MRLWQCEALWQGLGLDTVSFPYVISIVGSGGKTSLMGQLAEEGKKHNLRVAVLTTTHIRKPPAYQEVFSHMEKGTVTIFGKTSGEEKLKYPGASCYNEIVKNADFILVEADGSRGLPLKCPAEYEPVIPEHTDMILCVCGMSGLGKAAGEVCHRWAQADVPVTEELLAGLLEEGYGKPMAEKYPQAAFFYCMNQADQYTQCEAAGRILKQTGRKGIILSMKDEKNILYERNTSAKNLSKKELTTQKEPDSLKTALIYMASGFGRRYGSNKLLETVEGEPLYRHGLQALAEAADRLRAEAGIAVTLLVVSQYEEILKSAQELGAVSVFNPESHKGITASIQLGIRAAEEADAYLFAVADQPWLKAESICRLVREFYSGESTIACLTDGARNGNPVIFSGKYQEELLELSGDRGGSVLMKRYPKEVQRVLAGEKELIDIDKPLTGEEEGMNRYS